MPDLLLKRDEVLACLQLMIQKPFSGGCEAKITDSESDEDDNSSSLAATRKTAHCLQCLVTKSHRNFEAVRNEVIQTAHNFFEERLHDEQQANVSDILKMANAAYAPVRLRQVRQEIIYCFDLITSTSYFKVTKLFFIFRKNSDSADFRRREGPRVHRGMREFLRNTWRSRFCG